MSYTAPSGSTWQVTNNYDINPTSGYYRAFTGEYRGSPGWGNVPANEVLGSCSLACDSKPDCAGWALDGNGKECYIISGNVKTLRSLGGRKAYVRTSARPTGKYTTTPQPVTLGTAGGHYCQGDGWPGDAEGMEIDKQGGNRYCIENFPRPSRCPADLGAPVVANIVNSSGGATNFQTGVNNTKVVCKYNSIPESIVWDDNKMAGYFGGNATFGATKQIRLDWCEANNMTNPKCTPYVRTCPAVTLPCKSRASDITCPAGYDAKDIPNNKCMGYTLQNVAQVNCPTGYSKASGNTGMCAPNTACTIAPGYQGAGGAC